MSPGASWSGAGACLELGSRQQGEHRIDEFVERGLERDAFEVDTVFVHDRVDHELDDQTHVTQAHATVAGFNIVRVEAFEVECVRDFFVQFCAFHAPSPGGCALGINEQAVDVLSQKCTKVKVGFGDIKFNFFMP